MLCSLDSAARILAGGSGDLLSLRGCQIYLAGNGYELDDEVMHAVMKRAAEYRRSLRHPPLTNPVPASGANGGALTAGNGAVADVIVPRSATAPNNTETEALS
jgi:hypothetical protein